MRVETLGEGEPEVAVVGGIHGDEPCGPRAIEAFLRDPPPVERPVEFIVANEEALARNLRYVEEDLNRAIPVGVAGERPVEVLLDVAEVPVERLLVGDYQLHGSEDLGRRREESLDRPCATRLVAVDTADDRYLWVSLAQLLDTHLRPVLGGDT